MITVSILNTWKELETKFYLKTASATPQWPKEKLNKTFTPVNETFARWMDLIQGFQKCFFQNPRNYGIETTS